MLMPRTAVMSTVTTTKMIDLISGAASPPRFMAASPQHHLGTAEQRCGEQAAPGGQRARRPAEPQAVKLGDEFTLRRRAGQAARPEVSQQRARTLRPIRAAWPVGCRSRPAGAGADAGGRRGRRPGAIVEMDAGEGNGVAARAGVVAIARSVVA